VALQRNRDAIAARLEIEGSELDVVAARLYPNPVFEYAIGNLLLGTANLNNAVPTSSLFDQPVQTVGVTEIIDVWMKRSARIRAADRVVERRRLLTEDALRGDRLRRPLRLRGHGARAGGAAAGPRRRRSVTADESRSRRRGSRPATSRRRSCGRSSWKGLRYQNAGHRRPKRS
jgi:hypothetical protein